MKGLSGPCALVEGRKSPGLIEVKRRTAYEGVGTASGKKGQCLYWYDEAEVQW